MSVPDLRSTAALIDDGQTAEAQRMLEDFVASAPTHVAAYVLLARIAEVERDFESALNHWRRAYELNPLSPVVEAGLRRQALRALTGSDGTPAARQDEPELDHLIRELETARIIPDPNVEAISEEELENDLEDLVSETLARIYVAQNHYDEARRVYETLARQHPERASEFKAEAIEMKRLARENE